MSNYFIGNDPDKWYSDIPSYGRVQSRDVYPGIDLVYYGNQRQLEYDFVVAPGADPAAISLDFEGADKLSLDAQGNLILRITGGEVILNTPIIYQEIDGVKQPILGSYLLRSQDEVGFLVTAYDASLPLVIDPVLVYSTYLGGSANDRGYGIAIDSSGNASVVGDTTSTNFPTLNLYQGTRAGGVGDYDAFVTKFSPSGTSLWYSTYLGSSGDDAGYGIVVDSSGDVYVTGEAG